MNLWDKWKLIDADLRRARQTLPDSAADDRSIRDYQEFLDNNELGLACDLLEVYAEEHPVNREFWEAMRDAAIKMELPKHVRRFEARLNGT